MTKTPIDPDNLPPVLHLPDSRAAILRHNKENGIRLLVLDDDPTGCQTVHDVPILTSWDADLLARVMAQHDVLFVLTNSRAFPTERSVAIHEEIASRLKQLVPSSALRIVSRSDSTLRGHYQAEVDTLSETLGPFDGVLIVPFFGDGGRVTIQGMHYVRQQGQLIEAHQTEFARDPIFGYSTAYLPAWVEEKTGGKWHQDDVLVLTLHDIRVGGPDRIYNLLRTVSGNKPIVVDALCDEDLEVVMLGLCRAEADGKRFLYRTAASFVKIRAGMPDKALLKTEASGGRGLVIVGSHVRKSTEQVQYLLDHAPKLARLEVKLASIFSDETQQYRQALTEQIDAWLTGGRSVVVYTEREYALQGDTSSRLRAGEQIATFLSTIVRKLTARPDFIIAKGGITSLDIAQNGLIMREGLVVGQVEPGVPLWHLGEGSKHPGLRYVVFPGNVGEQSTLLTVYQKLCGQQ